MASCSLMDQRERAELVNRAAAGDADALQRLIVYYHAGLRGIVAGAIDSNLRRHIDPDDVLQQAYISAFNALDQNRERQRPAAGPSADQNRECQRPSPTVPQFNDPAQFYKWLERIALNQLKDIMRGLRRQKRDIAREAGPAADRTASYLNMAAHVAASASTPSRKVSKDETVAAVLTCLARLKDAQREVVRLRFLENVPVAEIAAQLNKSDTAIYTLCHRGLKSLRELMGAITHYLSHL